MTAYADTISRPVKTLTEAAKIGYQAQPWPHQYQSAKSQMEANFQREKAQSVLAQAFAQVAAQKKSAKA